MKKENLFSDQQLGIKQNKAKIKREVEYFKLKNNIQVHCISDQTLLYIRYILAEIERRRNKELEPVFKRMVEEVYKETRGSNVDIGISMPSTFATAIIMVASEAYKKYTKTKPITQKDIYDIFLVHASASITHAKKKLDKFFNEKNIRFDLKDSDDQDVSLP